LAARKHVRTHSISLTSVLFVYERYGFLGLEPWLVSRIHFYHGVHRDGSS
jgi:hypothetical protein